MFCNSTITDLFLFVFTQLILHYQKVWRLTPQDWVKSLIVILLSDFSSINSFKVEARTFFITVVIFHTLSHHFIDNIITNCKILSDFIHLTTYSLREIGIVTVLFNFSKLYN